MTFRFSPSTGRPVREDPGPPGDRRTVNARGTSNDPDTSAHVLMGYTSGFVSNGGKPRFKVSFQATIATTKLPRAAAVPRSNPRELQRYIARLATSASSITQEASPAQPVTGRPG